VGEFLTKWLLAAHTMLHGLGSSPQTSSHSLQDLFQYCNRMDCKYTWPV